jgi:hypothetical protein
VLHEFKRYGRQGVLFKIDFEKAYDKVRWDFVFEVLREKGFLETWIHQVMSTVQGGQVCINMNGERTQYFRTYQGLRQEDPFSPLLFNLVAEVLAILLRKASNLRMIKGVMSHLIPEGITHIQYADDTILMVDGNDASIVNMKLILYCFEWLSGLKINYHKSKAYIFGMGQKDKRRIANMLNCQLGELPMKYLGIPLDTTKLGREALAFLPGKISKRIPPWKGKQMSWGGRLILTNSCLTSMPTYMMDFYLLPQGTHR